MTVAVEKSGIEQAIAAAGTQVKLGESLGVKQQTISEWLHQGWVPIRRALEIEALYGVPRSRLINPRVVDLVDLPTESEGGEF